ncbi:uncharacterized protein AB675_2610 [Cyphellophora attinorum]|uniref:MmgE/PrpD family protein n=1 Tax=Cyphellophora attinorum TaxID=1664694 RepID=A0A0N0NRL5_9EURO|nr:uncharacterized protein AB675_2610 [Phialophora attinorum]KPI45231.1 hypothetical protein AB675_2610 [Phialophora attinorum]
MLGRLVGQYTPRPGRRFGGEPPRYINRNGGPAESTAFGCVGKVNAGSAAFVNGTLAHSPIRDDMHLPSVAHLGSMVVTAALALAEREDWSGEQLLRAIVGGYEMGAALGTAIHSSGKVNTHLRSSGLIGAFAAVSAAVCGSPPEEDTVVSAFCIAVNQACGFNQWAWSGGSELPLQNGMAARAGVFAYDLALTGVRASETILEGQAGFFEAVGVGLDGADAFRRWLQRPMLGSGILEVKFKPMGCCNFTQTSTAMALKLAKGSSIVADDIKQIVVTTTSPAIRYPGCDNSGVMKTVVHGKLSIQYGVCAALVLRQLDETAWYPAGQADITGLMTKCQLVALPKFDEAFR